MRLKLEKDRNSYLLRCWIKWVEVAYLVFGLRGPRLEIEFPSDWHEHRMGWVRFGFGIVSGAVAFPWRSTVPDEGQCSGPIYGFYFFQDHLVFSWGKSKGTRGDPRLFVNMPWSWRHREHKILSAPEKHDYIYRLRSGEIQQRTATIKVESRMWTRYWLPWRRLSRYIDVDFSDEVGERTGSWKGGTTGCSYNMLADETPLQCLRRMERERSF